MAQPSFSSAAPAKAPAKFSGALRWAIYDVGHTAFTMIVLAVLFPILFNQYWAGTLNAAEKTSHYSLTLAVASILVAVISPLLASFAQCGGVRMLLFRVLAGTGILGMAALAFVGENCWAIASAVYIVAGIGFFGANLFYDSLLIDVASVEKRHFVSGFAFSVGYIGGILLLGLVVVWTQGYTLLGFESRPDPRWLFALGALWWLVFALPLLLRKKAAADGNASARAALRELRDTAVVFWKTKNARYFLLAYFCYIDGVHTTITSTVRYGDALGFTHDQLFTALFIVQAFGVPFALFLGWLGKIFGARPVLFSAIFIYIGIVSYGASIEPGNLNIFGFSVAPIYVLAALIGCIQGGVQALSRSYFSSLIPAGKEVSFFGFYSMIGRCSTIVGPLLIALAAELFSDPDNPQSLFSTRLGIASLALLFIAGIIFLAASRERENPHEKEAFPQKS